jgi:hypothetical protein
MAAQDKCRAIAVVMVTGTARGGVQARLAVGSGKQDALRARPERIGGLRR